MRHHHAYAFRTAKPLAADIGNLTATVSPTYRNIARGDFGGDTALHLDLWDFCGDAGCRNQRLRKSTYEGAELENTDSCEVASLNPT